MEARKRRPVIRTPLSRIEVVVECIAIASIAFCIYLTIHAWLILPERIPSHFNLTGQPDAYSNKSDILYYPILAVIAYVLMTLLARYPHFFNYPWPITEQNTSRQYRLARELINRSKLLLIWLLLYAEWLTLQTAAKQPAGPVPLVFIGIIFLLVILAIYYIVVARQVA